MATTRAALHAVKTYLITEALRDFRILGAKYEPTLIFGKQVREQITEFAKKFGETNKDSKWLAMAYSRDKLGYDLKRQISVHRLPSDEEVSEDIPLTEWKWRIVNTYFRFAVFSPDPSYIEDLEETVIVRDLGKVIQADAYVHFNETKQVIPCPFDVNVERFEVEGLDHLDDGNEGVFSILTLRANVNYPIIALHQVYGDDGGKLARTIDLRVFYGDTTDVELFHETYEAEE